MKSFFKLFNKSKMKKSAGDFSLLMAVKFMTLAMSIRVEPNKRLLVHKMM